MKNVYTLYSLLLIVHGKSVTEGSSVTTNLEFDAASGQNYSFIAYTKDKGITFDVTFVDLSIYSYSDRLVLSNISTIHHIRDGTLQTKSLIITSPSNGWDNITVGAKENVILITFGHQQQHTIELEYWIQTITAIGSNLTLSEDGGPSWEVKQNEETTIPLPQLNDNDTIELTIFSDIEFTPQMMLQGETDKTKELERNFFSLTTLSKNQIFLMTLDSTQILIKRLLVDELIEVKSISVKPQELIVTSEKGHYNITLLLQSSVALHMQTNATDTNERVWWQSHKSWLLYFTLTVLLLVVICFVIMHVLSKRKNGAEKDPSTQHKLMSDQPSKGMKKLIM
ncbi:unnamed protein product [Meganyctiphanes norvegica]|uniref:Uncharacterized protein n=1 Tax=Meganyctiphanes norvegica TaxID=48144 RepID=A0AAV2Q7Q9_MEGNR